MRPARNLSVKVLEAENGRQAFAYFQEKPVDVIISDVRMPGGSGIELLERIRELKCAQPIVILVSAHSDINESEALKRGAQGFFPKPCHCEIILEKISAFLLERKTAI